MHFIRSTPDSWFNLPRVDGVAYAAQESWVQNETIRVSKILILTLHDLPIYIRKILCLEHLLMKIDIRKVSHKCYSFICVFQWKAVLHQCALERDLELFDAGDATEVGEKGLTLR